MTDKLLKMLRENYGCYKNFKVDLDCGFDVHNYGILDCSKEYDKQFNWFYNTVVTCEVLD